MAIEPPDPPLSDGVVALRLWGEPGDADAIVAACNDREIAEFLDQIPSPYREGDAQEFIEHCAEAWRDGSISNFAITDVGSGRVIGSVGVRWLEPEQGVAEIGYWLAPDARGRGACTRAVRLVSGWVFAQTATERLQLRADELNAPSRKVAENAGFRQEGILRSSRYNARLGRRVDFVMYSLLREEA